MLEEEEEEEAPIVLTLLVRKKGSSQQPAIFEVTAPNGIVKTTLARIVTRVAGDMELPPKHLHAPAICFPFAGGVDLWIPSEEYAKAGERKYKPNRLRDSNQDEPREKGAPKPGPKITLSDLEPTVLKVEIAMVQTSVAARVRAAQFKEAATEKTKEAAPEAADETPVRNAAPKDTATGPKKRPSDEGEFKPASPIKTPRGDLHTSPHHNLSDTPPTSPQLRSAAPMDLEAPVAEAQTKAKPKGRKQAMAKAREQ